MNSINSKLDEAPILYCRTAFQVREIYQLFRPTGLPIKPIARKKIAQVKHSLQKQCPRAFLERGLLVLFYR